MDTTSNELINARIASTVQDLPNQRVIRVDAERVRVLDPCTGHPCEAMPSQTRAGHPLFKTEDMRARIRRIMTYYVKNRSVVYKQGLNEMLPPFVLAAAAGLAAKAAGTTGVQSQAEEAAEEDHQAGTHTVQPAAVERVAPDAVVYQMLERTVAKVRLVARRHHPACLTPPPLLSVCAQDLRRG